MHGDGWWGMSGMWVVGLLSLVILVLLIVWIARWSQSSGPRSEPPEEILKRRYARGEIDRNEYEQRLKDLREH
jgi:putative membrane protein